MRSSSSPSPGSRHWPRAIAAVLSAYTRTESLSNDDLYEDLAEAGLISYGDLQQRTPVGKDAKPANLTKRRVRWWQQTLKAKGLIERMPCERAKWRLAAGLCSEGDGALTPAPPGVAMIACSTRLGVALWGSCASVFGGLTESYAAIITSPPYPLAKPRAYGNVAEREWVDWICTQLEPIIKNLIPGGQLSLNLGNDVFEPGLPSRSLYRERLVLALYERFGLHKMDEIVWHNPSKPPGPVQWASKQRMQLNVGWEPIYVFCNDPARSIACNQRVLQPHTAQHLALIARGGEKHARTHSDGAYTLKQGSYGRATAGRIPKNVLTIPHNCADQRAVKRHARAQGLAPHGASMPLALALFLVAYLSRPGDLVVDPFGGSLTTAKACEELGRLWMCSELMAEYLVAAQSRFSQARAS